jgi:hypothetical protein
MFPHERSLVKRMQDRPFALIGVNSDRDLEDIKKKNEEQKITWRSFQNEKGVGGSISKAWEVQGWPTLYLIDHKGVIHRKFLGNPGDAVLDRLIDQMVQEAEKESK